MSSGALSGRKNEPGENEPFPSVAQQTDPTPIEIDSRDAIYTVAFFVDGKHVVGGGMEGTLRCWQVDDGKEAGTPLGTKSPVRSVAVSDDGLWVVGGTYGGQVTVWDATSHAKVTEFTAHTYSVWSVDVSRDGARIATGSDDCTVCVWSFSTGQRLLGPLEHDNDLAAVKFSPDGLRIATATWMYDTVQVYDSQDGRLLLDFPIRVNSARNQSIAWAGDGTQLFALSSDGHINRLDAFTGAMLSKWPIHSNDTPRCIGLAGNGRFIAASANSSVSFWDIATQQQIGSVVNHTHSIWSMAISAKYNIATGGDNKITLRDLGRILPAHYCDDLLDNEISQSQNGQVDPDGSTLVLRSPDDDSDERLTNLEKTNQELRIQLAVSQREKENLSETVQSLHFRREASDRQIADMEKSLQQLRHELANSRHAANQEKDTLNETVKLLRADLSSQKTTSDSKITGFEEVIGELRTRLASSQRKSDNLIQLLRAHERKHQCETLFSEGRISDAAESLLEMTNALTKDVRDNQLLMGWISEYTGRCVSALEKRGDEALGTKKRDEALRAYSTALSLAPSPPVTILAKWSSMMLIRGSVDETLNAAREFKYSKFAIYKTICDVLEGKGRFQEAIMCLRRMQNELTEGGGICDGRLQWELDFRERCVERLDILGDRAMASQNYEAAIRCYSSALSLEPADTCSILVKCCKARAGLLEEILSIANKDIERNPSLYQGYKRKHTALHAMGRHQEAFKAFEMMLSKIEQSPNAHIRELRRQYIDATPLIRSVIEQTIRDTPRVLIDISSGRLCDKTQQVSAFEALPIYDMLRSSMTTRDRLDHPRIQKEVQTFYRYVMFSHRWQPEEPTFQMVQNLSIYGLSVSPTNDKLLRFCQLAKSFRFRWAWSDTCCINQLDRGVQQESVVAMFRWYRGSSLTVVHLLGIHADSQKSGYLWKSIWNTRGWTYQEYVASEVVQFYTEDWKPYLGLDMFNHKQSPLVLSEMEHAMNLATDKLTTLQPGLDRVREKLYLASRRETTREEDIAYSLFGIFDVAIPVIYGEGSQALRRFLEYILTRSGDITMLAWTGASGTHNSFLPADLTVYDRILPPHVPQPIEPDAMNGMVTMLRSSLPNMSAAVELYERLHRLPPLSLVAGRLRLSGIIFPLTGLTRVSKSNSQTDRLVYRGTTPMLGDVRIETASALPGQSLLLVHPWVGLLLDQDFTGGVPRFDLVTRALRFLVCLRRPFGALLLAPLARAQYRRVAADSLIMVQVRQETPLGALMDGIERNINIQ